MLVSKLKRHLPPLRLAPKKNTLMDSRKPGLGKGPGFFHFSHSKHHMPINLQIIDPESCDDCGLCCEGIGSPVVLFTSRANDSVRHPFRPDGMPQHLIDEIDHHFGGLARGQEPQQRCLWFDTKLRRCKHYEWRPQVCHDYQLGGDACLLARQAHREKVAT